MSIANYCPDDVNCLAFGIPLSGFADGTFISITKDKVPFGTIETADGQVARLFTNSQTYTITLVLHRGSPSNDVLTKLWQLDELTQKAKFPLFIKDLSGSDLFFSTTTWIEGLPNMSQSASFDTRTWVLRSSQAVVNFGSNQDASGILQDLVNLASGAAQIVEGVL
jgi:hypothetical protein